MPPNTVELPPMESDPERIMPGAKPFDPSSNSGNSEGGYYVMLVQSTLNLLAHILIGVTVTVCFLFAFNSGLPLGGTPMHVVLCVAGYNLLMAEGILSLTSHNGWSSKLRVVDRRRAHWIIQIMGSVLAIAGSIYKIYDKIDGGSENWNTLHGQFALVALVFTTVSLVNGVSALWAYELRKILPGTLSKLSHICFGTVAYSAACISLCYGIDKNGFRNFIGQRQADVCIALVAISTFIIVFNPAISFFNKSVRVIKS